MTRQCSTCKLVKEDTAFYIRRTDCKPCAQERIEANRLKRKYNLTAADVEQMIAAQDHKCLICAKTFAVEPVNTKLSAVIDHDHDTGIVRGVICRLCNSGLGHFGDNATILRNAVDYLESRFLKVT